MAEFNITAVCTVSDPKEQKRQWGQVYRLLMELPLRIRCAAQEESVDATELSVDKVPTAAGG